MLSDDAKVYVKLQRQEPSKKGTKKRRAGKEKVNNGSNNDDGIPKDFLSQEPIKGFLQRAQQEFRIYLATENAWPHKKSQHIQKMEVPQDVMLNTVKLRTSAQVDSDRNERYFASTFLLQPARRRRNRNQ